MSAPVATTRQTPAGIRLTDGHPTMITFAADPDVSLWEMTVKPFGLDGGDAVNTTTMHNVTLRTMGPRKLKTLSDSNFKAAYDPACYNQLLALVNVRTTITVTFPDGSTVAAFGFLQKFEPDEIQEGTMPTATCHIVATNQDSSGTEQNFTLVSVAGT